jgi:hypothetical protein
MNTKKTITILILLAFVFAGHVYGLVDPNQGGSSLGLGGNFTIQSVLGIITGLACWLSRMAIAIIVIMIVFYGFQFMTSQGDPTKYGSARKSLMWAIVGAIVILGTYTIIASVANFVDPSINYNSFIPLNCSGFL